MLLRVPMLFVCAGSCKAGGAESNCQGSGVIIDDSARVSDGVVTAIADCVEEAGNILQVGCCSIDPVLQCA